MPTVEAAVHSDPFRPVMRSSPALLVTAEQRQLVREVLALTSSDSRFAQKAFESIEYILTAGTYMFPAITSITPNGAVGGSPPFTMRVLGSGFGIGSVIVFSGVQQVTTRVSDAELTATIDVSRAQQAVSVPVAVLNSVGISSNTVMFAVSSPVIGRSVKAASTEEPEEDKGLIERFKDRREEKKEERRDREKPDNTLPETTPEPKHTGQEKK